jgi:hypothetical protein
VSLNFEGLWSTTCCYIITILIYHHNDLWLCTPLALILIQINGIKTDARTWGSTVLNSITVRATRAREKELSILNNNNNNLRFNFLEIYGHIDRAWLTKLVTIICKIEAYLHSSKEDSKYEVVIVIKNYSLLTNQPNLAEAQNLIINAIEFAILNKELFGEISVNIKNNKIIIRHCYYKDLQNKVLRSYWHQFILLRFNQKSSSFTSSNVQVWSAANFDSYK